MAKPVPLEDPLEDYEKESQGVLKMGDSFIHKHKHLLAAALGAIIILAVIITPIAIFVSGGTGVTPRGLHTIPRADTIKYTVGDSNSIQSYTEEISTFLKEYDLTPDGTFIECSDTVRPKGEEVCIRRPSILQACRSSIGFGFESSTPCVLLTLYLEDSFKPEPYQSLDELPSKFPPDLRRDVERTMENGKLLQGIWVDCNNNVNLLEPEAIFPDFFFDNIGAEKYMPPFIAVQFDLSNKINETVNIECKVWAKNIDHSKHNFSKVNFTLHVKDVV